jgi:aspartate/glutamate racemase
MKIPGILGGLGSETTAKIYLALSMQEGTKEYPNIIISNVSFPKVLEEEIVLKAVMHKRFSPIF